MTEIKPSSCTMRRQSGQDVSYFQHVFIDGICKYCELPKDSTPAEVAPIILELDRLQEEQLKRDKLAYFSQFSSGSRFSSLNDQSRRAFGARRQERMVELIEQLNILGYEYKPLQFQLEFYIKPAESEKRVSQGWKQRYHVEPGLKDLVSDQSGCKHEVEARTLLEGSERALAEHLIRQCDYQSIRRTDRESAPIAITTVTESSLDKAIRIRKEELDK